MRRFARPALLCVAASLLLAGCSGDSTSSSPTADEQVCDARAQVLASVEQVKQDIKGGDFGQVKDDIAQVGTDIQTLVTAQQGLAQDKKSQVEPLVGQLQTTLGTLTSATSLAQLGAVLDTALSQLSEALTTIGTTVECS